MLVIQPYTPACIHACIRAFSMNSFVMKVCRAGCNWQDGIFWIEYQASHPYTLQPCGCQRYPQSTALLSTPQQLPNCTPSDNINSKSPLSESDNSWTCTSLNTSQLSRKLVASPGHVMTEPTSSCGLQTC
jgi:hypothetical protein